MRVDRYDAAIDVALGTARALGLYAIVRVQDLAERRLTVAGGVIERQRTRRSAGVGVHVFGADGSVGFASTDDLRAEAVAAAVQRAGALVALMESMDGERTLAPYNLQSEGRRQIEPADPESGDPHGAASLDVALSEAQQTVRGLLPQLQVRTSQHVVDDQWRIARSDGTDVSFATPRATVRHELTGRAGEAVIRASASVSGVDGPSTLLPARLDVLAKRTLLAARHASDGAGATAPPNGPCRVVLDYALAKGLAHEAIGHLCESDVDGSALMRGGRLRLGERLASEAVSVVDGPLLGDYAGQPISANGLPRQTVALIGDGVLAAGLGDLFSAERAGIAVSGACRAASFRDRPTPRMTNIRIVVREPLPLTVDPEALTPELVAATLRDLGLLDRGTPTVYLAGYRGGQAHPRRGDFIFAADAAYQIEAGGPVACRAASLSGLAERALAAIVAGIGPLRLDAVGACGKDGSVVPSSGGSHALLVLAPDPALAVT